MPVFRRARSKLSHARSLEIARDLGFAPRVIYDIGAFHGAWSRSTARIFPKAQFILFEANANNESALKAVAFPYFIAALGARDGVERQLYLPRKAIATGVSLYREATSHYAGDNASVVTIKTRTLDAIAAENRLEPPQFIKIDVQGAEVEVLAGAEKTLASCEMLLMEVSLLSHNEGAPLIGEVFAAVAPRGFKCVDICEIHRIGSGLTVQADLVFVREPLYRKYCAAAGLL